VPPPDGGPERLRALSGAIVAAVCGVCTPLQRELLATSTEVERHKASAHALRTLRARAGCEFEESCIRAAKAAGFDPAQLTSAGDLGLTLLCGQEVEIGVDLELARSMRERSHNIPPPKSSGIRGPGHADAFKPGPKRSDPVLYDTSALEAHIQKTVTDAMFSAKPPVVTLYGFESPPLDLSPLDPPPEWAYPNPWAMGHPMDPRPRLKSAAEAQWDADVSAWGFRPEQLEIGPHRPVRVFRANPADVSIWIDGVQVSGPVLDPRYLAPSELIKLVSGHTFAGLDPEPPRE
jgi:hypothetical protein